MLKPANTAELAKYIRSAHTYIHTYYLYYIPKYTFILYSHFTYTYEVYVAIHKVSGVQSARRTTTHTL